MDSTEKLKPDPFLNQLVLLISGAAIGVFGITIMLSLLGRTPKAVRESVEREACAAGVATYVANPTNGVVTFKWNNQKQ